MRNRSPSEPALAVKNVRLPLFVAPSFDETMTALRLSAAARFELKNANWPNTPVVLLMFPPAPYEPNTFVPPSSVKYFVMFPSNAGTWVPMPINPDESMRIRSVGTYELPAVRPLLAKKTRVPLLAIIRLALIAFANQPPFQLVPPEKTACEGALLKRKPPESMAPSPKRI